jgi:hypothetical protein
MINIYINIAVIGSVNEVLNELLNRIDTSGLYKMCDGIHLVINGDKSLLNFKERGKYIIHNPNKDISHCEFPTLDLIWRHSQIQDDLKILYLHTKGVTKPNNKYISDWTELLTHFNVDKWYDAFLELEKNDAVGVNFFGNPNDINEHPSTWGYGKAPLHFSGNFWWSKSSHIKKLKNPYDFVPDNNWLRWRVACEMWVCSNQQGDFKSLWNSNVNHYHQLYPRDKYVS